MQFKIGILVGNYMGSNVAYRTLVVRRRLEEIPPELLQRFTEVQKAFRKWATEWYKSGFKKPMPDKNPLKYFAKELKYNLRLIPTNGLKNGEWRAPLPFDAQLRTGNEKDVGCGILVDLPKGEIRIRRWSGIKGNVITVRLKEEDTKWILERVKEGGKLKLAYAWVGRAKRSNVTTFNVALVFAREVAPIEARRVLAVDLNALHNGVAWGIVEEGRIMKRKVKRPDLWKIKRLQKEISHLDSLCAKKGEPYCKQSVTAQSRLYRVLRQFEDEAVREVVETAVKKKAMIVVDAPRDESIRRLKEGKYVPEKKLYLNIGRLRRRIEELAKWYGVPSREQRLYSTICPRCGAKMEELPNRGVRCPKCGFEAPRDKIPLLWAAKLSTQHSFFDPTPVQLAINLNP